MFSRGRGAGGQKEREYLRKSLFEQEGKIHCCRMESYNLTGSFHGSVLGMFPKCHVTMVNQQSKPAVMPILSEFNYLRFTPAVHSPAGLCLWNCTHPSSSLEFSMWAAWEKHSMSAVCQTHTTGPIHSGVLHSHWASEICSYIRIEPLGSYYNYIYINTAYHIWYCSLRMPAHWLLHFFVAWLHWYLRGWERRESPECRHTACCLLCWGGEKCSWRLRWLRNFWSSSPLHLDRNTEREKRKYV